ncbi:hypothetical protein L9F63_023851, partial [Diploptera punctata]
MENNKEKILNRTKQKHESATLESFQSDQDELDQNLSDTVKQNKIDFLSLNYNLLYIAGLKPPEKTKDTYWKYTIYQLYNILLHLLFLPTFLLQLYTLSYDWEDLVPTFENIAKIGISLASFLPPLLINWKKLFETMYRMETNSIFTKQSTKRDSKKMEIILETQQRVLIATKIAIAFLSVILIDEVRFPFSLKAPFDTSSILIYTILYIIICISLMILIMKVGTTLTFCFAMMMYISSQFMIVSKSIENIDKVGKINSKMFSNINNQQSSMQYKCKNSNTELNNEDSDISLIDYFPGVEQLVESIKEHQGGLLIWQTAYNLQWYRRSTKFKMLLIMVILQAQRPNYMYIGTVHTMSMEHFANV